MCRRLPTTTTPTTTTPTPPPPPPSPPPYGSPRVADDRRRTRLLTGSPEARENLPADAARGEGRRRTHTHTCFVHNKIRPDNALCVGVCVYACSYYGFLFSTFNGNAGESIEPFRNVFASEASRFRRNPTMWGGVGGLTLVGMRPKNPVNRLKSGSTTTLSFKGRIRESTVL